MAAISRIRCRANEEGLPRRGVGSVLNSAFSGWVGSIFKRLGLGRLVRWVLAGAGGCVIVSGSPGCAAGVVEGVGAVSTPCSSVVAG